MGVFQVIKNYFRKGAASVGLVESLQNITDHPKINVDPKDYERICNSLIYYEGQYPLVRYKNSNGDTKTRGYSTINMMKKVANEYATVVFNEQCEITVEGEASDFITEVFEHNDFKKNFSKYLEPMFALGGLACRPYLDKNSDQIEFSWALADAFYPLQSNTNNISECAIPFVTTRTENKKTVYYTLLEFHEWEGGRYIVTNELYRSEDSNVVGVRVPLVSLFDDLEERAVIGDLSRPIFAYVKPSGFNNINPYSPLGLGVCDNCKYTLDRINRAYDEFDQEVIKGKRRILVSDNLLKAKLDENGRLKQYFDVNEDIFQKIPGSSIDDITVKDMTVDIRSKEYIEVISNHLKTLEMEVALSPGTFDFDSNGIRSSKTATEVVSENSQTYQTRAMQVTNIEKFIKELVISVCELGKLYGKYDGTIPKFDEIGVDLDDGAFQDKDKQLNFYLKLTQVGYPVPAMFEKILNIPLDEAEKLYRQGLMQSMGEDVKQVRNVSLMQEFEE